MSNGINTLIVSENGSSQRYVLDRKPVWEVGRPHRDNNPDIKFHAPTVSRKQGSFQSIDGTWFYIDNNRKNGTTYNGKRITAGIGGRIKPVMLKDGDVLVFGSGNKDVPDDKAARAVYLVSDVSE